jgi:hypothetical protein
VLFIISFIIKYKHMKTTTIIFLFTLIFTSFTQAQVGIGTTNPDATLDIRSSNQATPNNNDGLLIPKVDEFPATNPTALQDGMLVFVTGNGSITKGFYYWNTTTTNWIAVIGVKKINDLTDGKSDANGSSIFLGIDAGLNDDGTDNRNVGVGYQALASNATGLRNTANGYQSLYSNITGVRNTANGYQSLFFNFSGVNNTANGYQSLYPNTTGYSNTANGSFSLYSNTTGNRNTANGTASLYSNTTGVLNNANGFQSLRYNTTGVLNNANGSYSLYSNTTGNHNTALGNSAGYINIFGDANVFLGNESGYFETGSNKLYIEDTNADADNALIYGEFGTDNTTTGNILRINGELQLGTSVANRYAMPIADGTVNQILQTDGLGSLNWVNLGTAVTHSINDLTDGKSDTDDSSSIFLGLNAGTNDDGTDNQNIGIGYNALSANTSGQDNTAVGYNALALNTAGILNTSVGRFALANNTSGDLNTAIGSMALEHNTIGVNNVSIGAQSLIGNTEGSSNIAIGYRAMLNNGFGGGNIALGSLALSANNTGIRNIAIGGATLDHINGNYNIALGTSAGSDLTSGDNNIFIGFESGGSIINHSKSGSVFIGHRSGQNELNSNRLYIHNNGANEDFSLIYGEFDNSILRTNSEFQMNKEGTSGTQTIVAGIMSNTSNRPLLQFSETANIGLGEGMSLEYDGRGSGNANRMVINNIGGSPLFEFRNGGSLTLTGGDLIVNGNASKPGGGSWAATSDKRLKQNINSYQDGLETVLKINPVKYHYNQLSGFDTKPEHIGVIAQDLQKITPYMVSSQKLDNGEFLAVDNSAMTYMLINAVKTQQEEIQNLKEQLNSQQQEIDTIKKMLKKN